MMYRSKWKLPFISPTFFGKRFLRKKVYNIKLRGSIIPKIFVNKKVRIHNGRWFISRPITTRMIGYKFGEFSFTKRSDMGLHLKIKKTKKKKR